MAAQSEKQPGDADNNDSRSSAQPVELTRLMQLLACGTLREEHGMLRWSSNYTFLVSVSDGELTTMAVYKPQRGERPLWAVSDALGGQIVPPTILRDGPRGLGSLQFYIQNNPDVNYFSLDEKAIPQLM